MFAVIWVRVTRWGYRREEKFFSSIEEAKAHANKVRALRCAREVGVWAGLSQVG